jgi:hypothetical protein
MIRPLGHGFVLDLRARCLRRRCHKLIRKGKLAQANYQRYKPFCSYACQEWNKIEEARDYINRMYGEVR